MHPLMAEDLVAARLHDLYEDAARRPASARGTARRPASARRPTARLRPAKRRLHGFRVTTGFWLLEAGLRLVGPAAPATARSGRARGSQ